MVAKQLTGIVLGITAIIFIQAIIALIIWLAALFVGLRIFGNHDFLTQLSVMFLFGIFAGGMLAPAQRRRQPSTE